MGASQHSSVPAFWESLTHLFGALPRPVIFLGLVSFLSDVASNMVYPLLPLFLTGVLGASPVALGAIEGLAEATASLVKLAAGLWSDRLRRRLPLIALGYSLAAVARPLIGLARVWPVVLMLRVTDRIGNGVRAAPRDALIADVVPERSRGFAYGYQRALDNGGAMVGPLVAAALIGGWALDLRSLFILAALPGGLSVLVLLLGVREAAARPIPSSAPAPAGGSGWRLGRGFNGYLLALLVFSLGASSDAFLLLQLNHAGLSNTWVAIVWSAFHGVKVIASLVAGKLTDRFGPRPVLMSGWFFYALVYLVFSFSLSPTVLVAVFIGYGVYHGISEPSERAWVTRLVPENLRATGFGLFHGTVGLAAIPASLIFGLVWQFLGPSAAFLMGAALALVGSLLLVVVPIRRAGS